MLFVRGSSAKGRWIPVLPNLFRGYDRNVSERTRKIARQTDPKECVEAVERAKTAANEGLRFVDGVLYQTTRAPAWSVDGEARLIPCMPDHDDFGQFALIDARYKQERILESFRKLRPLATRSMSLFEPSLLPNTSGVDSIGTFCQYILESARRDEVLFLTLHIEELMAMTEPAINGGPVPARAMTVLEELNRMGGVTRFPDEIRLTYQFLNVFPSPSDTPECDDPYADGPPILH